MTDSEYEGDHRDAEPPREVSGSGREARRGSDSEDEPRRQEVDPDRRRARRAWRIAGVGSLILGTGLALVVGVLGGSGQAGMAVFLLIAAASCGIGALYATATLLIDDLRGRPTSRRRPIAAGVLFVLAALLMAMVAGIGG